MIQINPLQSYIDGGARAAITSPPSASLVFDLPGKAIWVKGVKLKGTDHTYTYSHDNYITLTNTPDQNNPESEDIKIGVNITTLKPQINSWRSIYMNQDLKQGSGYDTKGINFKAGSGIQLTYQSAGTGSGSNDYGQITITANNQIPSNNVTGSGTANYITKWTGTNTIGNLVAISSAITTQTTSTKFLREDGTWAVPSYVNDTWRQIQVNGSIILSGATNTDALNFVAGTGIEVSWDSTNKRLIITNSATSHTHKFKLGNTVIETAVPDTDNSNLTATTVIAGPFGINAGEESSAFSIFNPNLPSYRRADHWIDNLKYSIQYKSNNTTPILEMSVQAEADKDTKKTFVVRLTQNNSTSINNELVRGAFHPSKAGGTLGTADKYWYQVHAAYFIKTGSDNTHVLLGGGGHKLISDFATTAVVASSDSSTSQISATQSNPYYNLIEGGQIIRSIRFLAGNGITISAATDGQITITNSQPDINHNTDNKVQQTSTSTNYDYPVILKGSSNLTANTTNVNFSQYLLFNPSTKLLKVNGQTVIHTGNITNSNATISNTLTTIASFGGVEVKAKVDYSDIISSYLSQWDISVDKASFELTREWVDSGISLQSLNLGPCLLYINYCGVHYTGIFAYSGTSINTDDEFPLHCSGYTQLDRGRIFAKISAVQGAAKLMLAAQTPETNIPLFTIKIKQIAKL